MACQKRGFRRHKMTSLLAIIGLVFQAVVAAVMLPMPMGMSTALAMDNAGANADARGGAFSSTIVICTPEGFKRVTFDRNGNPVEEHLPAGQCPVCDALAATAFALPAMDASVPAPFIEPGFVAPGGGYSFVSAVSGAHNNRGPPLTA